MSKITTIKITRANPTAPSTPNPRGSPAGGNIPLIMLIKLKAIPIY